MSDQTATPVWICKSASGEVGVRRIRMEYEALDHLAPWAEELQIPQVIAWEEFENECRLTQTGISGRPNGAGLNTHVSESHLDRKFGEVLAWIDKFESVALPRFCTVDSVAASYADKLEKRAAMRSQAMALIQMLLDLGRIGSHPAVPTHGDLHWGNVLLQHPGVGVIDWATFDCGFPLQNKFGYIVNNVYFDHGRCLRLVENYHHVFFSDSPACRWLSQMVRQLGYPPNDARLLFYCFFANQLCLDAEMQVEIWLEILDYLGKYKYPRIGTPLPPPRV